MREYTQDRYHIFKRELKNARKRVRDIEYLEKTGNTELLSVEKNIIKWIMDRFENMDDACAKYYLFEIYIFKRISLNDASLECGYKNASAFVKMMKKSVEPVLSDEAMAKYLLLFDREQQLLKEGLSEIQ